MKQYKKYIQIVVILSLCLATVILDFIKITYTENPIHNAYISKIIQQGLGILGVVLLLKYLNVKLFGTPQNLIYLLPCLVIAIDNFQWSSFLTGKMQLVHSQPLDVILFGAYCFSVGMFEECIFRGVIFSILASRFTKDGNGFWITYLFSSGVFAIAHLFNGLSFGTILQVGYTFLTGGLFAFVLIKTKNLLCCGLVHAIYNFCGLLFERPERMGLGSGVVFDLGTVLTMLIVSVCIGLFVLVSVYKYSDEERGVLYQKLGVKE